VDSAPGDSSRIYFGAWVTLEDASGEERVYRIVGADEFDPKRGWISIDSPMAGALLRHGIDDAVSVSTPQGRQAYVVVDVQYADNSG
jgi:transcription elongation factor GreB